MKEAVTFYSEERKSAGNRQPLQTKVSIRQDGTRVQASLMKGGEIEGEEGDETCVNHHRYLIVVAASGVQRHLEWKQTLPCASLLDCVGSGTNW